MEMLFPMLGELSKSDARQRKSNNRRKAGLCQRAEFELNINSKDAVCSGPCIRPDDSSF